MISAAVVVPVYKERLSLIEEVSLSQCLKIFKKQSIHFALPCGLNPAYLPADPNIHKDAFNAKYFEDVAGYNKLMLSSEFYRFYGNYEYILIYQLDAFVFADELEKWCNFGFDYIGAPWFSDGQIRPISGNGGFSLRKVKSFILLLSRPNRRMNSLALLGSKNNPYLKRLLKIPRNLLDYFSLKNTTNQYFKDPCFNEDYFYSVYGSKVLKGFKVATPLESIPFSFEAEPEKLFCLNNRKLPFGCHAFEKNNPLFWKEFIPF